MSESPSKTRRSEPRPAAAKQSRQDRISGSISGILNIRELPLSMGQRDGEAPLTALLRDPQILFRDLVAGSISALVTLSYAISFAAMIFAGDLARHLDDGVRMALLSAGVTVILVSLTSPFYFAMAGPDSRSAAVQKSLGVALFATLRTAGIADPGPLVLVALAVSTTITGVALYALGLAKMGRWIRYVPYPVIGGFLVSTGWVLLIGGINVITNIPVTQQNLPKFMDPDVLIHLAAGFGLATAMLIILGRAKHYLWLPGLLLGGTMLTHIILLLSGKTIEESQRSGWLLNVAGGGRLWQPLQQLPQHLNILPLTFSHAIEVVVLTAVTAIAVLVTGAAIEVATKRDSDLDQELKGHGIANVAAGLLGGVVGSNAVARSTLNLQAGAATRLSGVIAGALCLMVLLTSPKLAGYLARPVMGATLLYLSIRLMQEWLIRGRTKLAPTDYALVVLMFMLVVWFKTFVISLLVGALASCLIFAVNYSRVSLVRNSFTVDEYGSKVQRSAEEHQVLRVRGRQFWVLRLRGYLFFGSIVGLVNDIRRRIRDSHATSVQPLRVLVLDFRYVNGMDSSAVLSLVKLRQIIEERKMQLVFTELQSDMESVLRREGCIRNDDLALVFSDIDAALEWCEQRALALEPSLHRVDMPFVQRLGKEFGSVELAQRYMAYVDRIELKQGEYLFRQGDASGATYVIESGRLSIVLERDKAPPLLLRSVTGNTTIGEMGLYRQSIRSASVVAHADTVIHRLTSAALERMEVEEPKVAAAFHTYVVRTLADRLYLMDQAISALER